MNITDYFSASNQHSYTGLQFDALYSKTIKEFYESFIRPHFQKMFVDNKNNFIKWCEVLEDYANNDLTIFWIRKFESGSGKDMVNDNRRTGTTALVDNTGTATLAYAYISNFDAQELYNIILTVDPFKTPDEFKTLMLNGKYKFHYDCGKNSNESAITSFDCLCHANSLGVFNRANLYLAHISDVNGIYNSTENYKFTPGEISEWKDISTYKGYDFLNIFSIDHSKKLRVEKYSGDVRILKDYLRAHFFRFVHPFNYYLVPGKNYEVNAIMGKSNVSIGEYQSLTNYVKYRMYIDFIKNDVELKKHFNTFESNILISKDQKICENFDSIEKSSKKLENIAIHVVYGTSVGKSGNILKKLDEKITNTCDLWEIYTKFKPGANIVFYDKNGSEIKRYTPKGAQDYTNFLEKLLNVKINKGAYVKLQFERTAPNTSTSSSAKCSSQTKLDGGSRRKYDDDIKLQAAALYLTNDITLEDIEKAVIKRSSSGSTAKGWLNKLGIDTSPQSKHRGLLAHSNIDTEISRATGKFKETLEGIKKRGV